MFESLTGKSVNLFIFNLVNKLDLVVFPDFITVTEHMKMCESLKISTISFLGQIK